MNHIGELNEQPLHAALKAWYAKENAQVEVSVDGYIIDVVEGKNLIEIQTGNFSTIKKKLFSLVKTFPVCLVYPVAREKWLLKLPKEEWDAPRRRKSPKRGQVVEVFNELIRFPQLVAEENFSLEVVMIEEEEVRRYTGKRWRTRGWETVERRLLKVVERKLFRRPSDMGALLPPDLPPTFTTTNLAQTLSIPQRLAQKMAYCLREMGAITKIGKRGRAYLYTKTRER